MVEVNITEDQVSRAEKLYPFKNLNGSITNGVSNIYGALGEILIMDYFGDYVSSFLSTYDYDLIISDYTIDVKTKKTTVIPQPYYYCSVSEWNISQKCDFYVFVRVMTDLKKGFILGYMSPVEFYDKSIYKKKGELDINGFVFKDNCYNIEIKDLRNIEDAFAY